MQRLKTRPQFQAVLSAGVVARTDHFVLHRARLESQFSVQPVLSTSGPGSAATRLFPVADTWLGAMVPKRWAKRAVTRNAIKRQIYIVSADFLRQSPPDAFLVRLRREFSRKEFPSAASPELKAAVRRELFDLMHAGHSPSARNTSASQSHV